MWNLSSWPILIDFTVRCLVHQHFKFLRLIEDDFGKICDQALSDFTQMI